MSSAPATHATKVTAAAVEAKLKEVPKHEKSFVVTTEDGFKVTRGAVGEGFEYLGVDSVDGKNVELTMLMVSKGDVHSLVANSHKLKCTTEI